MDDLFGQRPTKPPRKVGYGNAMFLCDLADGVSDDTMRKKYRAGEYPHLHHASIDGWRRMNGRTTSPKEPKT